MNNILWRWIGTYSFIQYGDDDSYPYNILLFGRDDVEFDTNGSYPYITAYRNLEKGVVKSLNMNLKEYLEDKPEYITILFSMINRNTEELFNNYMEELNKNKDIKIIIDSEELGLL